MSDLSIFGLKFETNVVIFEIITLKFVKYVFLTQRVNFLKGPIFLKVRGLGFFEDSGFTFAKSTLKFGTEIVSFK